jgi:hypothetical protein
MERCKVNMGDSEKHFEEMGKYYSWRSRPLADTPLYQVHKTRRRTLKEFQIMQTNWMPTLQHARFNKLPWE